MFYVQNISIYMNFGGTEGHTWPTVHFLFIMQKNGKVQEHDIYYPNSTPFWIFFFLGWIIKTLGKGPPEIKERGGRCRCNWAMMSSVAPCDTPTLCGESLCLWGRRGHCARIFFFFLLFVLPTFTFFILQKTTPPTVFII